MLYEVITTGSVTANEVRSMVGLADRAIVFDLFESLMQGNISGVLEFLQNRITSYNVCYTKLLRILFIADFFKMRFKLGNLNPAQIKALTTR